MYKKPKQIIMERFQEFIRYRGPLKKLIIVKVTTDRIRKLIFQSISSPKDVRKTKTHPINITQAILPVWRSREGFPDSY